jgi:hypothetical protein
VATLAIRSTLTVIRYRIEQVSCCVALRGSLVWCRKPVAARCDAAWCLA